MLRVLALVRLPFRPVDHPGATPNFRVAACALIDCQASPECLYDISYMTILLSGYSLELILVGNVISEMTGNTEEALPNAP